MYTEAKVKTFHERFAELVEESGKTNMELSKELHVANQTISAWKLGIRSPKQPTVITIANHFGVTIPWLMGFDVEKYAKEQVVVVPDSELFGKLLRGMEPEDYRTVMQILEKTEINMREKGLL